MAVGYNFLGAIIAIVTGLFFWMAIDNPRLTHKAYQKESDPEKKASLESDLKEEIRSGIVGGLCFLLLLVGYGIFVRISLTHEFTEVYHTIENKEVVLEVKIDSVDSEKDREDVYHISLIDTSKTTPNAFLLSDKIKAIGRTGAYNTYPTLQLSLTESEYDNLIGKGNNKFRTNISILSLETETFLLLNAHGATLYRIEEFFGTGFTKEEAEKLGNDFLTHINTKDCEDCFVDGTDVDIAVTCKHY